MTDAKKNTRIEFHILQSFPVTCLNRDDVGAPKTATVGGVTRARVSSQCWKRQVRMEMQNFGVKLGSRTKQAGKLFKQACMDAGAGEIQAEECGELMAQALAEDTLLYISLSEAKVFAQFAKEREFALAAPKHSEKKTKKGDLNEGKKPDKKYMETLAKELGKTAKKALDPAIDALDIALFGRMVAKSPTMSVQAAASFSHAISTHKINNEVEFFTAIDDLSTEPGSSHMGSLEYNSATYYRYISLDLGELSQAIGSDDLKAAVAAFTRALFVAVPSARQSTQSGASPWDFARVLVREGQRLQVPFETAVKPQEGGFLKPSIEALTGYIDKKEKLFGSMFGKKASYDWGLDDSFSIDDLVTALQGHVE